MIPIIKPFLGQDEADAAAEAVLSGWVAQGPRVRLFEQAMADYVGAASGIAVSSATTGLHLALIGCGVGRGDDVVVPSLSFIATANAVQYCGARPVFADVDPVTQNVTAATVSAAITPATRAVMLVHQVGMPADIDAIANVCRQQGLGLIEDAACAAGSTYKGRPIGAHSAFAVFSFHPRKVLTTGEGGMLMCRDEGADKRLRTLRQHAMSLDDVARHSAKEFVFEGYPELGYNYRMTDIQAAVGLVQLRKLPAMVDRRRELAEKYRVALADLEDIRLPVDPRWGTTNFQSYAIKLLAGGRARRNAVLQALTDLGIGAKRGIMAAHLEGAYRNRSDIRTAEGLLPETVRWSDESFVLPLYHTMTAAEHDEVVSKTREVLAKTRAD